MDKLLSKKRFSICCATFCAAMGCGAPAWAQEEAEDEVAPNYRVITSPQGIGDLYGHDPNDQSRIDPANPANGAVVYIKFGKGGSVIARNAYFVRDSNEAAQVDCLIDWLAQPTPANTPTGCNAVEDPGSAMPRRGAAAFRENFAYFDFGSPHILYVFIDNDDVKFNDKNAVSFTPFGADRRVTSSMQATRTRNTSWNAARIGPLPSLVGRKGLTINNAFRDARGNRDEENQEFLSAQFSMNLHLWACAKSDECDLSDPQSRIDIIVDPDTGNGRGSRP